MTLEEYVEGLNDFLEMNPEAKELSVVYASDPEGNDWHYTFSSPTMISKEGNGYSRSTTYNIDEADEICIN